MSGRFHMELTELSEDSILKSLFNAKKDPIEVSKNAVEYPPLRQQRSTNVIMPWYNLKLLVILYA